MLQAYATTTTSRKNLKLDLRRKNNPTKPIIERLNKLNDRDQGAAYHRHVHVVWVAGVVIRTACCLSRFGVSCARNKTDREISTGSNDPLHIFRTRHCSCGHCKEK